MLPPVNKIISVVTTRFRVSDISPRERNRRESRIMPMMHNAHEEEGERRYDPDTLRKVTALAARLQSEHQEKLTMRDMEQIGAEVGLEAGVESAAAGTGSSGGCRG